MPSPATMAAMVSTGIQSGSSIAGRNTGASYDYLYDSLPLWVTANEFTQKLC